MTCSVFNVLIFVWPVRLFYYLATHTIISVGDLACRKSMKMSFLFLSLVFSDWCVVQAGLSI